LLDKGELGSHRICDLEEFAYRVYPCAARLPESRLLRTRRKINPRLCPLVQYVHPSSYVHRLRRTISTRRAYAAGV
jgi:hypothetical protein